MKTVLFWWSVIGVLALTGCTTSPWQSGTQDPSRYAAVDYYSWVLLAAPADLALEISRLEHVITIPGAEESLVQLALGISATTTEVEQEARALRLLAQFEERAADSPVASDYQVFAGLWRQLLELRQQAHGVDGRIQALERERSALREQIEALTSIEQQLDRRGTNRGAP